MLEPLQLGARLEAELGVQQAAGLRVGLEGIALPAGAIQRQHPMGGQTLAQRVLLHERAELGNERFVTAEAQVGLDAQLQGIGRSSSSRAAAGWTNRSSWRSSRTRPRERSRASRRRAAASAA